MKLVNTSSKVISIGDILLMPDKEVTVNSKIANLPAVKAFANKGFIRIDDSAEREAEIAAKARAEAEAKAKAEAEAKEKAEAEAKNVAAKSEKGATKSDKAKASTGE